MDDYLNVFDGERSEHDSEDHYFEDRDQISEYYSLGNVMTIMYDGGRYDRRSYLFEASVTFGK